MKNGIIQPAYPFPVKRYVKTMLLKDEPELLDLYKYYHSPEGSWPEIRAGIREVGILEMDIYIEGNFLVMIIVAPADLDMDKAMARLAALPRQSEWEAHVSKCQQCNEDDTSDDKWKLMDRIFYLYE